MWTWTNTALAVIHKVRWCLYKPQQYISWMRRNIIICVLRWSAILVVLRSNLKWSATATSTQAFEGIRSRARCLDFCHVVISVMKNCKLLETGCYKIKYCYLLLESWRSLSTGPYGGTTQDASKLHISNGKILTVPYKTWCYSYMLVLFLMGRK